MERLTERTVAGVANLKYDKCFFRDGTKDRIACSAYRQRAIERLAAYEDTGLTPEEAAELAEAQQDGRLVVLPFVEGTKMYEVRKIFGELHLKTFDFDRTLSAWESQRIVDNMGKTVFLARAEAEEAIGGKADEV